MSEQFLTIADFAARAGVTKQAVYKQLNNRLNNYCKLVDGQKKLEIRALKEVYGIDVEEQLNNNFNEKTTSSTTDSTDKIAFDAVMNQLEALQKELDQKNEQISKLEDSLMKAQENLEREQQLHLISQQKILRLETAANEETATTEEPAVKESFWRRLFGN